MFAGLFSLYQPTYLPTLVYMLQNVEYQVGPYLKWYWRTKNFNQIMYRRSLERTKAATSLLLVLRIGFGLQMVIGLLLIWLGYTNHLVGGMAFGIAVIVVGPVLWAHLIVVPILLGRWFIVRPRERHMITKSERIFATHPGIKIAVAGSYGKTTMKELLYTVLREGKAVAATPANKNVSSSHARFAQSLTGKEDILIIEYGEGAPGDVARFAGVTHPTDAIITGLAPAHLDKYKSLKAAGEDIFSVSNYVDPTKVYVNTESKAVKPFLKKPFHQFDATTSLGWKIEKIHSSITGTEFTIRKGKKQLHLSSRLVGKHQVTYLAFVAAFAEVLGLSDAEIIRGINATQPFEHRMQSYQMSGATIIDDTYNGNLEGIRAGTQLLKSLKAKRKIYVTPGLVDQGEETENVHLEVGALIAAAQPDIVVLMNHSVTGYIEKGLKNHKYRGEVRIEDDPLEFYANLNHFIAAGDVVVMQNDWPDNYY